MVFKIATTVASVHCEALKLVSCEWPGHTCCYWWRWWRRDVIHGFVGVCAAIRWLFVQLMWRWTINNILGRLSAHMQGVVYGSG